MLNDLSFLEIGQQFPPMSEYNRLEMYKKNRSLFECEHADVYFEAFKRIERVIGNFQDVVSYPVIINYQKLISLKIADLLLGEAPRIVAGESGSEEQKSVDTIIKKTDLFNTAYESALDVSRYGDGLFYVYNDGSGGQIDVTQPSIWFPVVDLDNIKRIKFHVLAWVTEYNDSYTLSVEIHEKGRYEKRKYILEKTSGKYYIKSLVESMFVNTGLNDFAIIQIPNIITSDRIHGMDDYTDIDSIISELLVRIGQISIILDKHANPSVSGPASVLEKDPITGEYQLKMGNFFARENKDSPEISYITWDGQLEANFKMIEQLINFLHAISEMGGKFLGDDSKDGAALSGTALRFKMISPLAKAKRITNRYKTALEKAITLCSRLGGKGIKDLSDTPISITFMDGLPNDPREEAEIMQIRTGTKPTMSVKRALKMYDHMSEEDAEFELAEIEAEDAKSNPYLSMNTPFNGNNNPNGTGA
ncbi:phage portal protein [Paenibacillus naphthalenovorans]|uniref:phage portal protein n=1 Tax=Paenibacillus naphthalenovorans TaxID=162209 RepID=UPI003D2BD35C